MINVQSYVVDNQRLVLIQESQLIRTDIFYLDGAMEIDADNAIVLPPLETDDLISLCFYLVYGLRHARLCGVDTLLYPDQPIYVQMRYWRGMVRWYNWNRRDGGSNAIVDFDSLAKGLCDTVELTARKLIVLGMGAITEDDFDFESISSLRRWIGRKPMDYGG